jgi:hypothetical protein
VSLRGAESNEGVRRGGAAGAKPLRLKLVSTEGIDHVGEAEGRSRKYTSARPNERAAASESRDRNETWLSVFARSRVE